MNKKFAFKDLDQEGLETLEAISQADNFNEWIYKTISKYTSGKILEIGSGIGNISKYFLENGDFLHVSDIRENYRQILKSNFSGYENLEGIIDLDIVHTEFDTQFREYFNYFDSIFSLNVFEHIENDTLALANTKKLLKPGGSLIVLVPAYQALYNHFDKELYHYRRYTAHSLSRLFEENNLKIMNTFYFNTIGILGWFVSGKIQRNKVIPKNQMELYNKLVPVFKLADMLTFNKFGLSVICVGKK